MKYLTTLILLFSASALAAPVPHGSIYTITGANFGIKPQAVPLVWDDASGVSILKKWTSVWPISGQYALNYTAPIRGIDLPHGNVTRYIAGAHGNAKSATNGQNVMLNKQRLLMAYPAYTYASWYQRIDDSWTFCGGDNNFKTFATSAGTTPHTSPYWYHEYNARPVSKTNIPKWHLNSLPNGVSSKYWGAAAVNPASGVWSKIEIEIKYSDRPDGYFVLRENGVVKQKYVGQTASGKLGIRTEGIGGYARCYGYPNNWRYFADVYLDTSLSRVVLANNVNLSQATIIEPQIPIVWTDNEIVVTVNRGRIEGDGWVHVVTENGVVHTQVMVIVEEPEEDEGAGEGDGTGDGEVIEDNPLPPLEGVI